MFGMDKFFSFFSHDIGIDLGTANTLVWVKGKGVVIREPSVVALHRKTKQLIAIGTEAKKMMGKTPSSILVIRPLKGGIISDFDATAAMIGYYIKELHESGGIFSKFLSRPKVVIGIPSSVTEVERRAVWEAALTAGARQAYLIEEPMAAAIGANISVFSPTGAMIVDIGGGTTEIAVISLGGIVISKSLKVAGDDMDKAIVHYIRLRHGLLIGEKNAEEVKIKIGSAFKDPKIERRLIRSEGGKPGEEKVAIVRGRDIETGLPKSIRLTEADVREALAPIIAEIIEAITQVIEDTPPELTSDVLENGIFLTGGGAKLEGIDHLVIDRTHISVIIADDPLTTVVRGTGKVLDDVKLLNRVKVVGGLQ